MAKREPSPGRAGYDAKTKRAGGAALLVVNELQIENWEVPHLQSARTLLGEESQRGIICQQ